jgi:Domain of unknown function (DUF4126)
MESAIATVIGICLAASCGFRVFVPMLVASGAANAGYLEMNQGFDWLGSPAALIAFAIAAVVESAAYYIPWLDHLLDTIASPAAVVAGAILFAASAVKLDPFAQWTLAIIAGGGSAALVQGGTILARLASTATTGGLANFVVSTVETMAGFVFAVLSMVVPLLTLPLLILAVAGMYYAGRQVARKLLYRPEIRGD